MICRVQTLVCMVKVTGHDNKSLNIYNYRPNQKSVHHDDICICSSKQKGKDQESIQSSITPDPGYQWKVTTSQLDFTNESQEVSPFPAGDHKASINRRVRRKAWQKQVRNNINAPQKKHRLGTVSKNILLEGLNQFYGAPTSPLV